jgi:hypothetical protein
MATTTPARTYSAWWIIKLIALILAILCFLVSAFGFTSLGNANLVDLGLALGFASFLPIN